MDCKFCGAPLEDGAERCPACGKAVQEDVEKQSENLLENEAVVEETSENLPENEDAVADTVEAPAEQEEARAEATASGAEEKQPEPAGKKKKLPVWATVLICLGALLLAASAALGGWIGFRVGSGKTLLPEAWMTALGMETTLPTDPTDPDLPGEESSQGSVVVATCGDHQLTANLLQIYYRLQYFSFMEQYGAYASLFGLDTSLPLDQQDSIMEGYTWHDYFLGAALEEYSQLQAVAQAAQASGFQLDEETAASLDSLPEQLDANAQALGYDSAAAYIKDVFGSNVSMEDYLAFVRTYYLATAYENQLYEGLSFSDAEIDAYYDGHTDELNENGIIQTDSYDVTIRHILIQPEDSDGDGDLTNESEEAWAQAEARAEEILAEYLADPTENNFSNLAAANSADGNAQDGGIYEGVYVGQMVTEFNDWCFDPARQPGDTGIVRTQFGYHVMYFVETLDTMTWRTNTAEMMKNDAMEELIEDVMAQYPMVQIVEQPVLQPVPLESDGEE